VFLACFRGEAATGRTATGAMAATVDAILQTVRVSGTGMLPEDNEGNASLLGHFERSAVYHSRVKSLPRT
jgi:hypothetical protein